MTEKKSNDTLESARKLLDHLPDPISDQLQQLLFQADKGIDVDIEIADLLYEYDNVRLWMEEQASIHEKTSGYSRLSGNPIPNAASKKWICPKNPHHWVLVIEEAEHPPRCKIDKIEMVRENMHGRMAGDSTTDAPPPKKS